MTFYVLMHMIGVSGFSFPDLSQFPKYTKTGVTRPSGNI